MNLHTAIDNAVFTMEELAYLIDEAQSTGKVDLEALVALRNKVPALRRDLEYAEALAKASPQA